MGGGTKSGTPVETRQASAAAGGLFQDALSQGSLDQAVQSIATPFQRLGTGSLLSGLGTSPELFGQSLTGALQSPGSQTSGLFAALRPFEQRATEDALANVRGSFGAQGGRFSRNLLDAEANTLSQLNEQFGLNRQRALLERQAQQDQLLQGLIGAGLQQQQLGQDAFGQALSFVQPGEAVVQEGILPSLLQAGAQAGTAALIAGSSREFKEDITDRPVEGDLDVITRMNVKDYRYKGESEERTGLIVEDDGTPAEIVFDGKYIDLYALMGKMVNAMKELSTKVDRLESRE